MSGEIHFTVAALELPVKGEIWTRFKDLPHGTREQVKAWCAAADGMCCMVVGVDDVSVQLTPYRTYGIAGGTYGWPIMDFVREWRRL